VSIWTWAAPPPIVPTATMAMPLTWFSIAPPSAYQGTASDWGRRSSLGDASELENYAFPPADQATTDLLFGPNRDACLCRPGHQETSLPHVQRPLSH